MAFMLLIKLFKSVTSKLLLIASKLSWGVTQLQWQRSFVMSLIIERSLLDADAAFDKTLVMQSFYLGPNVKTI